LTFHLRYGSLLRSFQSNAAASRINAVADIPMSVNEMKGSAMGPSFATFGRLPSEAAAADS